MTERHNERTWQGTDMSTSQPLKILMVHPRFRGDSFWNYQAACKIFGAKYPAPPLGLMTVAAMLPPDWDIRLIDENATALSDEDVLWADYVLTGGMLPQQSAILELCETCHRLQRPVMVGGPDITSSPQLYETADLRVLGEAEAVIEDVVAALTRGETSGTFQSVRFTVDVTRTPVPRFDLIEFKNYVHLNVQFSRGCPFLCEFCDIIELYGRKPRAKTNAQMIAELDRLFALGFRGHVDFVDDNLIGNKKAVKAFLPELIAWQKAHGYPFEFTTEASLNIADDSEFLDLMRDANFFAFFVGIESPDPNVLALAQKKQNTRRDIAASIRKIYVSGMFVIGGFIVGFDDESDAMAAELVTLIDEASIPVSMVGLLYALPDTQLSRRLAKEGRLHPDHDKPHGEGGDQFLAGLNFDPTRPPRDVLTDFRDIVRGIYESDNYFRRVTATCLMLDMSGANGELRSWTWKQDLAGAVRFLWHINVKAPQMRRPVFAMIRTLARKNPRALKPALIMAALYAHLGPFARHVVQGIDRRLDGASDVAHLRGAATTRTGSPVATLAS